MGTRVRNIYISFNGLIYNRNRIDRQRFMKDGYLCMKDREDILTRNGRRFERDDFHLAELECQEIQTMRARSNEGCTAVNNDKCSIELGRLAMVASQQRHRSILRSIHEKRIRQLVKRPFRQLCSLRLQRQRMRVRSIQRRVCNSINS